MTGFPSVPSWPLVRALERAANEEESATAVCRRIGISERLYRDWRNRAGSGVCDFNSADKVLQALDLLWWEVYTEDTLRRYAITVGVYSRKAVGTIKRRRRAWFRMRATVAVDLGPDLETLAMVRYAFTGEYADDGEQLELAA
jgi:hypothetical protein